MYTEKYTAEERKKLLEEIHLRQKLEEEKADLYNKTFRKSFLFKFSWVIRLTYILILTIAIILGDSLSQEQYEIAVNVKRDAIHTGSFRGTYTLHTYHLETDKDSYTVYGQVSNPGISKGDTLVIERNYFGKPIYYGKDNWNYKYQIDLNRMYYIILFFTLVSLPFVQGTFKPTSKILLIISIIDIIAIITYFTT